MQSRPDGPTRKALESDPEPGALIRYYVSSAKFTLRDPLDPVHGSERVCLPRWGVVRATSTLQTLRRGPRSQRRPRCVAPWAASAASASQHGLECYLWCDDSQSSAHRSVSLQDLA